MSRWPNHPAFRLMAAALTLIGMLFASGCLFVPRDAAEPDSDAVEWIRPISPENVLANMKAAIDSRTKTNFENSLAEAYEVLPSQDDVNQAMLIGKPEYFDNFGKERELAALDLLYTQVDALSLEWDFDPDEDLDQSASEATIILDNYRLTATYIGSGETVYEGYVVLTLQEIDGQWFLTNWDESTAPSSSALSWGRLRLDLDV